LRCRAAYGYVWEQQQRQQQHALHVGVSCRPATRPHTFTSRRDIDVAARNSSSPAAAAAGWAPRASAPSCVMAGYRVIHARNFSLVSEVPRPLHARHNFTFVSTLAAHTSKQNLHTNCGRQRHCGRLHIAFIESTRIKRMWSLARQRRPPGHSRTAPPLPEPRNSTRPPDR
jgi:hypothetical protein